MTEMRSCSRTATIDHTNWHSTLLSAITTMKRKILISYIFLMCPNSIILVSATTIISLLGRGSLEINYN